MGFHFKENIYPIAFLSVLFFSACHSLPPAEPPVENIAIDPRGLPWEKASLPAGLLGDWYKEGKIDLTVGGDTLHVRGVWSLVQSTEKSDSYYRIIYKIGSQYRSIYLRNIMETEVQIAYTDSMASSEEGASARPVAGTWVTLTSYNPWILTNMPSKMSGDWHIHDGKLEMAINSETVVLDGVLWEIDSVQTNRTVERLVLKRGESYKSFYYQEVGEYSMDVLLVDGKDDIQDRLGNVPGEWGTFRRWWDLIEKCGLYSGSHWLYDYSYLENYTRVYNTAAPIDSIVETASLKGQLDLEVTSSTIGEGTGSLYLEAIFLIDEEKGGYYQDRKNGSREVLTDSSWVIPGRIVTMDYEISLENDTLWYRTAEGKVFFASTKFERGAKINNRVFVYPFEFPKEGFPEDSDIFGKILLPDETIPSEHKIYAGVPSATIHHGDGSITYLEGQYMDSYVDLLSGSGFSDMNYFFGDYDQMTWYRGPQYYDPYKMETSFSCKLLSFTPGG